MNAKDAAGDSLSAWDVGNVAQESPGETVRPFAALVSFHFLRAAVRRKLALCVLSAIIGSLLGGAFLLVAPGRHTATSTLVLAHDSQVDPSRAMATDVGLLNTRTVAESAIQKLGEPLDPQDLLDSVAAVPPTSDVLELTLTAPSDTEAVSRLDAFTAAYLEFRAEQVSAQSDALLKGYTDRIRDLQSQIDELNQRIATLSGQGAAGQDRLGDAITERSQLQNQISSVQESAGDVTLRRKALVAASRVVDVATVKPVNLLEHVVIAVVSGLIGGAALGIGGVVLHSILSDRLRLRFEVASASGGSGDAQRRPTATAAARSTADRVPPTGQEDLSPACGGPAAHGARDPPGATRAGSSTAPGRGLRREQRRGKNGGRRGGAGDARARATC